MTRNQLFTRLNELCIEMQYSYSINSGGCCFVAACIAENLERVHIPFKVVCCWDPCHYWIKVSDRYLNSNEYHEEELLEMTSKDLYFKYSSENWNNYYSKKWNLIVSTRIKSLFNRYANSRTRLYNEVVQRKQWTI